MKPADAIVAQHREIRGVQRGRLFRKYFLLILGLVCGALLLSGGIGIYFSYQENKIALSSVQREKAIGAAARIEQFIRQIEQQLSFAALPQLGSGGIEQRRIEFLKLQRLVPAITDIAQIDAKGREQLSVSRLGMDVVDSGADRSGEAAFKEARPEHTWFGPVNFRKETEPYMSIAVRAKGDAGAVTVADVNLKFIWDVVTRIKIGKKGKAYVVDGSGHLVADPDIGLVLRKTDMAKLPQVQFALRKGAEESLALTAQDISGASVLTAYGSIEPLGWKVFVEQSFDEVFETLNAAILRSAALIVAGLMISALVAMWLARSMVRPIRILQEGAARIGAGDLDQEIDIRTGDELEALAGQFNQMTDQLRESYASLERKVDERTAELKETLDQQTATAEILKVISSYPADVQPVLNAIVQSASRLFDPCTATITMREGDQVQWRASAGSTLPPTFIDEARKIFPLRFDPGSSPSAKSMAERRVIEIVDTEAPDVPDAVRTSGRVGNFKSAAFVPLIREEEGIGSLILTHSEPGFKLMPKQLALVQTFADQAVIAIENVRLFNETKEALERQTATAEVLRVISSSPTNIQPVLDAVAERAARLCDASDALIHLRQGDVLRRAAHFGQMAAHPIGGTRDITRGWVSGRAVLEGVQLHIHDMQAEKEEFPEGSEIALEMGYRTILATPLMREGAAIGSIAIRRTDVRLFSDKQIDLLKTFADQAVIAIENVRLFKEIQEKSRQLEIANQHKSDFLANMSHELRTPLNAIIGFSEVLVEKMFGEVNDKQLDYLQDIHSSGKHLLSLINDILDLSKIEAGRMELDVAEFDLRSALENAMTLIKERAQRHGITLELEVDEALGLFRADERKFKQIMLNLLSNAVKFTPEGGKVSVRAKPVSNAVEFAVEDTGVGIAPEDQKIVFDEFKQVGRDYTKKAEGTGLGLALTKRFVELHGGSIGLDSVPGKGSTFTFTIPMQP